MSAKYVRFIRQRLTYKLSMTGMLSKMIPAEFVEEKVC